MIAGYVRVSTQMQAERDSLVNQEESIAAYAQSKRRDFRIYKDVGISAKDQERPDFQKMIVDIEAGRIDTVVVTKLDRITRSVKDLIYLKEFFEKHEISFIALTQNLDTSTPMGRFSFYVIGLVAQLEREVTAERVAEIMKARALKKKWNGGVIPYGFKYKSKGLQVNEEEAEVVRKIFDLYRQHKSFRKVTHTMNALGYRTRQGCPWAATSIKRSLQNPAYIGTLTYNKRKIKGKTSTARPLEEHILVENSFESILSRKVFYEVQEIMSNQRHTPPKSKSSQYLLTSLIKCGYCGASMYGHTFNDKRKAGRVYRYYRCNSHLQKGSSICKGNTIEVGYLENALFEELKKFRVNPQALEEKIKEHNLQYLDTVGPLKMQQKHLENKISKFDEKTTRLFSLYEDAIISKREFAERKTVLDEQRRLLNSELYELQQKITLDDMTSVDLNGTLESIGNLADVYDELEFSEKKELIGTVIGDIVVGEDWVDYSIYSLNKAVAYYDCMDMDSLPQPA